MRAKCAEQGRFESSFLLLEYQGGFNVLVHNFLIYWPILTIQTSMETGEANQYSQGVLKGEGGGGRGEKGKEANQS